MGTGTHGSAERGQTLVVMVFAIVGLLVAAGLTIDGGQALLERRRMQNAADAAALAGTRRLTEAICGGQPAAATDAAVLSEVLRYAQSNGVAGSGGVSGHYVRFAGNQVFDFSPPAPVGAGVVPVGAAGVRVTTAITRPTYFLGFVGAPLAGAGASATAVTGPPATAGGVRPFGVPEQVIKALRPGDCFYVDFKNCKDDDPDGCLIRDADFEEMSQHRGWLNLNHVFNQGEAPGFPRANGNTGANAIKEWMEHGWTDTLWADCYWSGGCRWGDYIHAKPGTNSSVIKVTPVDTPFVIPIFDIVPQYDQIPDPKAGAAQGGSYYYHVVGFATVTVPASGGYSQGGGWIKACVEKVIMGKGQASPNQGFPATSGACDTYTMAVTLWR
jgi:Flp pilus assembly protein TadG